MMRTPVLSAGRHAFVILLALALRATAHSHADADVTAAPYRLIFETFRDGNWELFTMNADGSTPVNVTKTPDVNELYPHVSPDGTKVRFVVDQGKGKSRRWTTRPRASSCMT